LKISVWEKIWNFWYYHHENQPVRHKFEIKLNKIPEPNYITLGRIALLPILIHCYDIGNHQAVFWLMAVAIATDILDGWFARLKSSERTPARQETGKMLDAFADKLIFIVGVSFCLEMTGLLIPIISLVPEILYVVAGLTAFEYFKTQDKSEVAKEILGAIKFGKVRFVLQTSAILLCLGVRAYPQKAEFVHHIMEKTLGVIPVGTAANVLFFLAAILCCIALFKHTYEFKKATSKI